MTLTVGGDKISRLTLAGNEFVNAEDVWLPCMVNADFSGTPILMHYDASTGVTSFIGAADITWTYSQGTWNKILLTLPDGYRFSKTDSTFPLGSKTSNATSGIMYGTGSYYGDLSFTMSGDSISAKFNWKMNSASVYPAGRIIIFMSDLDDNYTGYHCWTTTSVIPD
ncbi:hypothetical protein [Levilactobacillus angrenensis]|uniref:Uncharacterized protein n=1 Tax=Levilactobacillus angrenensis TaxID=2486020 RepID=A0ABW1UB71_9LACO|nr:hypothetical protein [Levilactobacillus angrenensis]